MNDKATRELLSGMYENLKRESDCINSTIKATDDRFMIKELTAQLESCSEYTKKVEELMRGRGLEAREPSSLSSLGTKMGIALGVAVDDSGENLARVYINAINKGRRSLQRLCNRASGECDPHVSGLCMEMIEKERRAVGRMEAFL